jgi:hypothetical protein
MAGGWFFQLLKISYVFLRQFSIQEFILSPALWTHNLRYAATIRDFDLTALRLV